MGTYVTIDEGVVRAAEKLEQDRLLGEVISELARRWLPITYPEGFPLLPISNPAAVVTNEHVNQLRDELL